MEKLLAKVALGFGDLEERVRATIREPRLRKIGVACRHDQFLDSSDLLVDEPAQLRGTVALGRRDSVRQQQQRSGERQNGTSTREMVLFVRHGMWSPP
ncbi:MAG TPA: hypothetical protein VKE51_26680 [Vicinamibacterales bacterium]|nr:hypothetical protein [Vicinamibacterales bacterium]